MRKAGAAAPALQSGRWFHTERTSLLFVSPYSNSPSLSEPTILYKQSGTALCRFVDQDGSVDLFSAAGGSAGKSRIRRMHRA